MIQKINAIVSKPFADTKELLAFYQEVLPGRIGAFRLDEVGPIMSVGSEEEVAGYLENKFYFNGIGMDMKDDIDWYGTPNGDLEWNGGFVRQGHFMYLADFYTKTGDEKYAKAIIDQMLDYIAKMPPYNPEGQEYMDYKKSTWRPFEVAGRAAENWPVALKQIIHSKHMTPDAFAKIFYSIYEHAVFLSKHHWRTGNHACLESAGLGVLAIFYQEWKEAAQWRQYSVDFLMGMLDEQFHADGYTKEMSGAYHWIALRNFFAYYQVGVNNGFESIFPQKYVDVIQRAGVAEFYQQKPDYSLPVTNDSNVTTNHKSKISELKYLMDDQVLAYRLSGGLQGKKPEHTSYFFDVSKFGVMRSDWTQDAVYACFDMGLWGDNHMNEDQLNVELSAYGRNLLVNSGRWRYTTSPNNSEWLATAQYFKSTASYNSLICDGYNQMQGDADGQMTITDTFDYAKGVFKDGYGKINNVVDPVSLKEKGTSSGMDLMVGDAVHTREVFFAKPNFFIVKDTVDIAQQRSCTQIWHMADGAVVCDGAYAYSQYDDANFIMMQLNDCEAQVFEGSEEPLKGWHCPEYDCMVPAPELNFTATGDTQVVFETLIYPVKGKVSPDCLPVFDKEITAQGTVYTVTFAGKTTTILNKQGEWSICE